MALENHLGGKFSSVAVPSRFAGSVCKGHQKRK